MKFFLLSPDIQQAIEGSVHDMLSALPMAKSLEEADVIIVPISRFYAFRWNPLVEKILESKPYVLVDYVEYGWDWDRKRTHFFGDGTLEQYATFDHDTIDRQSWKDFDQWVQRHPPAAYFKRELLAKDVTGYIRPIDYPCQYIGEKIDTKEQFDSRPLEVIYSWGLSHEVRKRVHGEIYKASSKYGYDVVSSWENINKAIAESKRLWAAIPVPHYARVDMRTVMHFNGKSKLSLSLPGAGIKCFRSAEAPVNSIMVLQNDPLAWAFPWRDNHNCLRVEKEFPNDLNVIRGLEGDEEVHTMAECLRYERLYDIYLAGLETIDNYRPANYCRKYLIPAIQSALS